MMKILEINAVNVGSTGKIMLMIAEEARKRGHRVITAVAKSRTNGKIVDEEQILIGDRITRNIGAQLAYYTGYTGCFSYIATRLFIKKIKKIQPDIIHIHNLHSEYINIPLLFNYIKKYNIPAIWTIHDCWPFTGCCAHFVYSNCEKWKKHCNNCPEFRSYPRSCWDNSSKMFDLKKKWYGDIKSLTLVVPSQWLADSVKKSFLGNYPIEVIYNGVDTNIYKYVNQDVRNKYGVGQDKVVLLGVAGSWSEKKGLKDYYKLIELLPEKFVIFLVGLKIKENSSNTSRLIYVENVSDAHELSKLYSMADILLSLSYGETFGMTIAEANACGVPAIVYNNTAQPELVSSETGRLVSTGNVEELADMVIKYSKELQNNKYREFVSSSCTTRVSNNFSSRNCCVKYVDMYEEVGKRNTSRW